MGLLADVFSFGDKQKRRIRGLLDNPKEELALTGYRSAETLRDTMLDPMNYIGRGVGGGLLGGIGSIAKKSALRELPYQIEHKPMTVEGGAGRLHDLEQAFGGDIYGKNALQFFGSGDPRERAVVKLMTKLRGKPDEMVTIYRGVPDGVSTINAGDWVTLSPEVAADYGAVISKQVPASSITSWPDSLLEFGYYP